MSRHPLNYRLECKTCGSSGSAFYEDFTAGDLICTNCGNVVGDRIIDTRSEWRTFSNDGGGPSDDPSRVGGPSNPLLDGDGSGSLETLISSKDGFSGLSKDLSRLQGRASHMRMTSEQRSASSLNNHFKTIGVLCERIGLPKVIADRARQLFKLVVEDERIFRGKGTDGPIAACLYLACREARVPRTFKEISALTLVPKKDIGRCCKAMGPFLERMASPTTEDFMARFCSYLSLPMDVQRAAVHLAQRVREMGCADGKSPISVASAGIYLVSHLLDETIPLLQTGPIMPPPPSFQGKMLLTRKSPKDISFVSGISEVTVRGTYKDLYPFRHELVAKELHSALGRLPQP